MKEKWLILGLSCNDLTLEAIPIAGWIWSVYKEITGVNWGWTECMFNSVRLDELSDRIKGRLKNVMVQ